jgi:hypothetical protein
VSKGWTLAPVDFLKGGPTALQSSAAISPEDQDLVARCQAAKSVLAAGMYNTTPPPPKPTDADRQLLEAVLADHPHFFYAEYLLAAWSYFNGDTAKYAEWLDRSLDDAPQVLGQHYQVADGSPIAGLAFKCGYAYPVGSGKQTGELVFPIVKTDDSGCFYIPFFHSASMKRSSYGWAPFDTDSLRKASGLSLFASPDREGAFTSSARVGVLPEMTARPLIKVDAPFTDPVVKLPDDVAFVENWYWGNDMEQAVAIETPELHLTWQPVPGATGYRICITESRPKAPNNGWIAGGIYPGDAHVNDRLLTPEFSLPLNRNMPVFDRTRRYGFYIEAFDASGVICRSQFHAFTASAGMMPMPLSKEAVQKLFDHCGVNIDRVDQNGRGVTISGTKLAGGNVTTLADREFFGLRFRDYQEEADESHGNYDGTMKFTMRLTQQ